MAGCLFDHLEACRCHALATHPPAPPTPAHLQLTGTLPAAWAASGSFTVLRTLSLDSNSFTGGLPNQWADLQALETLTASSAALSGPAPAWGAGPQTLTML